jgi:hypothetical protein
MREFADVKGADAAYIKHVGTAGRSRAERAAQQVHLAISAIWKGQIGEARRLYEDATETLDDGRGSPALHAAQALALKSDVDVFFGCYPDAEASLAEAKRVASLLEEWKILEFHALPFEGALCEARGRYEEASARYGTILSEPNRHDYSMPEHPARAALGLARVLGILGRFGEAEQAYAKAWRFYSKERATPLEEPFLLATRVHVRLDEARLFLQQWKLDQAAAAARQRIRSLEADLPDNHWVLTDARIVLAGVLAAGGRWDPADALFGQCLTAWAADFGDDHPGIAEICCGLAEIRLEQGHPAAAEESAARAIGVLDDRVEPGHALLLAARELLARSFGAQHRDEKAESLLADVVAIRGRIQQPDHPQLAVSRIHYARLLQERCHSNEAGTQRALAEPVLRKHLPPELAETLLR